MDGLDLGIDYTLYEVIEHVYSTQETITFIVDGITISGRVLLGHEGGQLISESLEYTEVEYGNSSLRSATGYCYLGNATITVGKAEYGVEGCVRVNLRHVGAWFLGGLYQRDTSRHLPFPMPEELRDIIKR